MSKITTDKIVGFDSMTDAEKVAALLDMELGDEAPAAPADNSEEIAKLKRLLNDATGEASKFKKQLREKETEAETKAREQAEATEKMQARLAELERNETISKHVANFVGIGYTPDLANTSAEAMADGNFAVVFENLKTFIESRDESIKAGLLKSTPVPKQSGAGSATITKEQFEAMGLAERTKLFRENRELYDLLSNK